MSRGSDSWRKRYWGNPCRVDFAWLEFANINIAVERQALNAFMALGDILRQHNYVVNPLYPNGDTGVYNCRRIQGSNRYSSHAWAIAIDINWHENPRRRPLTTTFDVATVEEIESLRTLTGAPVFRWGGRWNVPDPMHFEIVATPTEIATGILTREARQMLEDEQMVLFRVDGASAVWTTNFVMRWHVPSAQLLDAYDEKWRRKVVDVPANHPWATLPVPNVPAVYSERGNPEVWVVEQTDNGTVGRRHVSRDEYDERNLAAHRNNVGADHWVFDLQVIE